MKKAILSVIVGLMLGSAGFVAGVLYGSNRLSGTMTVDATLNLSGSFPANYVIGQSIVSSEYIKNTLDSALNVYLDLQLTKDGISSSSAAVLIAGNPVTPSCSASVCDYQGASFSVPAGSTMQADVGITFNEGGVYSYVIQAWGS